MATSSDFHEEISKGLECGICMALLHTPKILKCHHWFCKSCIDEIMDFKVDGSAVIACPLKCECLTFVDREQTTNSLPIPYQLTGLLDVFANQIGRLEKERKLLLCKYVIDCENKVSHFCNSCSIMFCTSCGHIHNKNKHYNMKVFLPVQFDTKNEKVSVICQEHNTFANFICCNKFICLYCTYRRHRNHEYATVTQEADQVREFVCGNQVSSENMDKIIENVNKSVEATNISVEHWRDVLKCVLNRRKQKCVSKYLAHLNREEVRLLTKYTALMEKHFQRYPEVLSRDYFSDIKNKNDIQIISEKDKIKRNVFSFRSDQVIPSSRIEFSESHFLHKTSLGKLSMGVNAYLPICNANDTTIQYKFPDCTDKSENAGIDWTALEEFVEEVKAENRIYSTSTPSRLSNRMEQERLASTSQESNESTNAESDMEDSEMNTSCSFDRETTQEVDTIDLTNDLDDESVNNTFENIGQQLTNTLEEVDQHFETLFQAIEDRFILSSSGEDEEVVVEEEESGELSSDERERGSADSSAEVEQICRTN